VRRISFTHGNERFKRLSISVLRGVPKWSGVVDGLGPGIETIGPYKMEFLETSKDDENEWNAELGNSDYWREES
jgi:hypothetical protein